MENWGRVRARARLGLQASVGATPEERVSKLNQAIQALLEDDVSTLVSCIPGHIEVGAVYPLVVGRGRRIQASLLHLSLYHSAAHCATLLLHLGANTEAVESQLGDRPLHCAVREGRRDLVLLLLRYGASPISTNAALNTPLHLAAARGQVHNVITLLRAGAKPCLINRYQETPWDAATLAASPTSQACADLILSHHLHVTSSP